MAWDTQTPPPPNGTLILQFDLICLIYSFGLIYLVYNLPNQYTSATTTTDLNKAINYLINIIIIIIYLNGCYKKTN